ncbi:MAG: hypothetical protein V8S14_06475 [Lachnospiraceae bacterium]
MAQEITWFSRNEINQLSYIIINAKARGMKIILNPSPMDVKDF